MSYGVSGNFVKARAIFETGIVKDPDYPCITTIWPVPTPAR